MDEGAGANLHGKATTVAMPRNNATCFQDLAPT
jgi:hypothetical protein